MNDLCVYIYIYIYIYLCSAAAVDELLDAALLHALNHVTKCGAAIKASNDALKADPEAEAPRDQGFTRPKVKLCLWKLSV